MSDRSLESTTPSIVAGSAGIFPLPEGSWSKVDSNPLGALSRGSALAQPRLRTWWAG